MLEIVLGHKKLLQSAQVFQDLHRKNIFFYQNLVKSQFLEISRTNCYKTPGIPALLLVYVFLTYTKLSGFPL